MLSLFVTKCDKFLILIDCYLMSTFRYCHIKNYLKMGEIKMWITLMEKTFEDRDKKLINLILVFNNTNLFGTLRLHNIEYIVFISKAAGEIFTIIQ